MTDPTDDRSSSESDDEIIPPWNAIDVLREKVAEAEAQRDDSIGMLRSTMSDQEALDEFGLDLGEIEG